MKHPLDNKTVDWVEVMALRSAYNNGLKTPETREACRIYIKEMRKRKAGRLEINP
jgi:hypothetical protein